MGLVGPVKIGGINVEDVVTKLKVLKACSQPVVKTTKGAPLYSHSR